MTLIKRIIGAVLIAFGVLLLMFQGLLLGVGVPKGYWFIHEWMFYSLNYLLIFLLLVVGALFFSNGKKKRALFLHAYVLILVNTTFFYYMGNVNLVTFQSEDGQHEVIIKEYKKTKKETIRLVPRGSIFGKEAAVFNGSSDVKAFEEGRYKVDWTSGDIAAVTYQTNREGDVDQQIFTFRSSDYVRYQNVAVSLAGRWEEEGNPENYFMSDNRELIYVKDGELYYYSIWNTEQFGIYSMIVQGVGNTPSLSIVFNKGTEYDGDSGYIEEGGTFTITLLSLEKTEGGVYAREQ